MRKSSYQGELSNLLAAMPQESVPLLLNAIKKVEVLGLRGLLDMLTQVVKVAEPVPELQKRIREVLMEPYKDSSPLRSKMTTAMRSLLSPYWFRSPTNRASRSLRKRLPARARMRAPPKACGSPRREGATYVAPPLNALVRCDPEDPW